MPHDHLYRRSTGDVPCRQRFDYWAMLLSDALVPMSLLRTQAQMCPYEAEMTATTVGPLSVVRHSNNGSGSRRGSLELARTVEHTHFLLVALAGEWQLTHRTCLRVRQGEATVMDSRLVHEIRASRAHEILCICLPPAWLATWIPDPAALVGNRVETSRPWGAALLDFVWHMRPERLAGAMLPATVLADHLGAQLALYVGEPESPRRSLRTLRRLVIAQLAQRWSEPGLTAGEVAKALNACAKEIHRALAAHGQTFAALLHEFRVRGRRDSGGDA